MAKQMQDDEFTLADGKIVIKYPVKVINGIERYVVPMRITPMTFVENDFTKANNMFSQQPQIMTKAAYIAKVKSYLSPREKMTQIDETTFEITEA